MKDISLPQLSNARVNASGRRRSCRLTTTKICFIIAVIFVIRRLFVTRTVKSIYQQPDNSYRYNWSNLVPSNPPQWKACYGIYQCSKLLVPLDYESPEGDRAAIALIKMNSTLTPGDERHKGPLLMNPGGPGSSGVNFVMKNGRKLRKILGEGYDIVGFDPRGIGYTTPGLFPFTTRAEAGAFYAQELLSANASESAIAELLGHAQILSQIVGARAKNVAEHMSTALVAKDMLTMVETFGNGKLSYWGFSYGTVLGATFAAMFPDKINRMVLDGVVDAEDYYSGSWTESLHDADSALMDLFHTCVRIGPLLCPLYEVNASLIKERVDKLLLRVKEHPIPFFYNVVPGVREQYGLVDYSIVKFAMLQSLVKVQEDGWSLIHALAGLEKGYSEAFWRLSARVIRWEDYFSDRISCDFLEGFAGGRELGSAVACGEADPVVGDLQSLKEYYADLAKTASFAYEWTRRISCSGWKVRAKERYTGPFVANTSFPILFIGNTADPVTPLRNAHKMAKGFEGAVVLTQNSSGHGSISATSICTGDALRRYFNEGKLPKEGTVCDVESKIFPHEFSPA
ncbi:alpha/beta-hydrolase [Schizopora paradoxa]|uniref:Alpha/beta-hydrolase n=1 Tax=Schizopora paradoxa TaxID=27342 RepID=A0A0H2RH89_9AGAM|nr:alpha/beta-hydrolase [Schizopora paradoxa]